MRRPATTLKGTIAAAMLGPSALVIALAAPPAAAQNDFEMTEAQFNAWLTNDGTNPDEHIQSQLAGRLARLENTCNLTAIQRQKLELAGRGDISRFQNQLAPLREEVVGKFFDQNNLDPLLQRIQPLGQRLKKGIFDEGSLFEKVVAASLDEEQRRALERARAEQIGYQYRAKVKLLIATLDNITPMLAKQREDLLAHLLKTTRPPRRWSSGQYDWYYVLFQASQASREEIGEILDDAQLRCFQDAVSNSAHYEQMLEREGMMPSDDEAATAPVDIARPVEAAAPAIAVPILEIGP